MHLTTVRRRAFSLAELVVVVTIMGIVLVIAQPSLVVGALAAEAVARAVVRAVRSATGLPGTPSVSDMVEG